MHLSKDSSQFVRLRFLQRCVEPLNDTLGIFDVNLVHELIQFVDKHKTNNNSKELVDAAYDIDEKVKFNRVANKDKQKEADLKDK